MIIGHGGTSGGTGSGGVRVDRPCGHSSKGRVKGGSEMRSAAPAIQGGGQADQINRVPLLTTIHSAEIGGVRHVCLLASRCRT